MPEKYVAESLYESLEKELSKDDNILIPRARIAREALILDLEKITNVKEVAIYETVKEESNKERIINELEDLDNYDLVFTSASTFNNFKEILDSDLDKVMKNAKIASIGPITTKAIEDEGFNVDYQACEYTIDGIIKAIIGDGNNEI